VHCETAASCRIFARTPAPHQYNIKRPLHSLLLSVLNGTKLTKGLNSDVLLVLSEAVLVINEVVIVIEKSTAQIDYD
jgi:hypothetical protein